MRFKIIGFILQLIKRKILVVRKKLTTIIHGSVQSEIGFGDHHRPRSLCREFFI